VLDGQSAGVDRVAWRSGTLCTHRRSRQRHLRAVLRGTRCGTHFVFAPASTVCRYGEHTVRMRWLRSIARVYIRSKFRTIWQYIGGVVDCDIARSSAPPRAKQSRYEPIKLTVLHATERGKPKGRDPIDWKLIRTCSHIARIGYRKAPLVRAALGIETFHKILKSGCERSNRNCAPPSDWSIY